jgi:hypothetical protein
LYDGDAVFVVDFQNAVEFRQAKQNTILKRQGAARQRRSRTARHDADVVVVAITQDTADLPGGLRQNDDQRHLPVGGQAIGFKRPHAIGMVNDALAGNDFPQGGSDLGAPAQNGGIRFGHGKTRHRVLQLVILFDQFFLTAFHEVVDSF